MTFITAVSPSAISSIRTGTCQNLSNTEKLDYELGKNTKDELFARITAYSGEGSFPLYWFAILDVVQLFTLANGQQVSSFEPFDENSTPQSKTTNNNVSGFLKAILLDTIR